MVITQKTLIGKTSRRLNELDPENLHRYSMSHYEKTYGRGFLFFFSPFIGGPRYFEYIMGEWHQDAKTHTLALSISAPRTNISLQGLSSQKNPMHPRCTGDFLDKIS